MKILALALAALLPCLAAGPDVDKGKTMGNPAAPMMFELYSDFMCPALQEPARERAALDHPGLREDRQGLPDFPRVSAQYSGSTCYSRQAAALAVAAARIGKYQTVSDALFRTQQAWGTSGKVWEAVAGRADARGAEEGAGAGQRPGGAGRRAARCGSRDEGRPVNQTPTLMITYKLKQQPWTQFRPTTACSAVISMAFSRNRILQDRSRRSACRAGRHLRLCRIREAGGAVATLCGRHRRL